MQQVAADKQYCIAVGIVVDIAAAVVGTAVVVDTAAAAVVVVVDIVLYKRQLVVADIQFLFVVGDRANDLHASFVEPLLPCSTGNTTPSSRDYLRPCISL